MVDLKEFTKIFDDAIKFRSKPSRKAIEFVLTMDDLTSSRALLYKAALAVMPYDEKLFILLADKLFPSIEYIFLMKQAISFFDNWIVFYRKALRCIYELPKHQLALGYAELSEALVSRDQKRAFEIFLRGIKNLGSASPTIKAGVSVKLSRLIIKLGVDPITHVMSIVEMLISFDDIAAVSKVYSLVKIATLVLSINKEFSKRIIRLALSQLRHVSIFRLFEAENILARGLVTVYKDDPPKFMSLLPSLDDYSIKPWRFALIRFIRDGYIGLEQAIDTIMKVSVEEANRIKNYLWSKRELKNKLERVLRGIIFYIKRFLDLSQ